LSARNEKITWITCPDCGSKIGIVISIGKASQAVVHEETPVKWPPEETETPDMSTRLREVGVDLELVNIEEDAEMASVTPKKFLGEAWGPINDAIRSLGGTWIRDGRSSRWEIKKEAES
jgi:hypothetical protein